MTDFIISSSIATFISFTEQISNEFGESVINLGYCGYLPTIEQNFNLIISEPMNCMVNIDTSGNVTLLLTAGIYGFSNTITPMYLQTFSFPTITSELDSEYTVIK